MILHWNYRNLKDIPPELLQNGNHIKEIYLKRNSLTSLPKDIGKLGNLTNLYLIGNQIQNLPSEIGDVYSLRTLDVSQNLLQSIPSSVGNMKGLEHLVVTQNQLTSLPKEIGQLKSLKFLELSGNMLCNLPDEIMQGLDSLEEFAIDGNPISHFPRCITSLKNLRYVSACKCNLIYLPGMPFYNLVNGKRTDDSTSPRNAVPQPCNEWMGPLSNFQLLFDNNPNLNIVPYWVLQLLGPGLKTVWCGFLLRSKPSSTKTNPLLSFRSIPASYHGVKLALDQQSKDHIICFDEDLLKIHNNTTVQPPSLLEQCLRFVYTQNLHRMPQNQNNCARLPTPILEPCLKYSSRSSVKDMSAYSSASESLYDPPSPAALSSSAMEIGGSAPNLAHNIETPQASSLKPQAPLLPRNLKNILDRNVVTRCFSCLKPIFTEAWLVIFGVPNNQSGHRHQPRNNFNRNLQDEEEEGLLQNANELQISCVFCCSKNCLDNLFRDTNSRCNLPIHDFLQHNEFKFTII